MHVDSQPSSLLSRPPGCKLEGQVVCDNHCLLLCLNAPSVRNDVLQSVALNKKEKKAFNINDLVLIVMDTLCRDTLPSRARRDKLSFSFPYAWREEWQRVQCHCRVYNNTPQLREQHAPDRQPKRCFLKDDSSRICGRVRLKYKKSHLAAVYVCAHPRFMWPSSHILLKRPQVFVPLLFYLLSPLPELQCGEPKWPGFINLCSA